MAGKLYGIEPHDRRPFNQLVDWWNGRTLEPQVVRTRLSDAVPLVILSLPEGWRPGRGIPLARNGQFPFVFDVAVVGYPSVYEIGKQGAEWFQVQWAGERSLPIAFDATAAEFKSALPASLREKCAVMGGPVVDDLPGGSGAVVNPCRWFIGLPEQSDQLEAVELDTDTVAVIVSKTTLMPMSGAEPIWSLVVRNTSPQVAPGALALAWYTQGVGLTLGAVEPRVFEPYFRTLPNTTTTTTTADPNSTTPAPTTTTTTSTTTTSSTTTSTTTTTTTSTTTTTPEPTTTTTTTTAIP